MDNNPLSDTESHPQPATSVSAPVRAAAPPPASAPVSTKPPSRPARGGRTSTEPDANKSRTKPKSRRNRRSDRGKNRNRGNSSTGGEDTTPRSRGDSKDASADRPGKGLKGNTAPCPSTGDGGETVTVSVEVLEALQKRCVVLLNAAVLHLNFLRTSVHCSFFVTAEQRMERCGAQSSTGCVRKSWTRCVECRPPRRD